MGHDFGDRFTFDNPALAALTPAQFEALTDEQLEALSPRAAEMAAMVRAHSLLLRRASTKHIYRVITQQSDPRIGLILAAGRDKQGRRIFPDIVSVKRAMFGPTVADPTTYADQALNIFVQGVRRVSVALTASLLIAEFAPADLTDALRYALNLEKQAIEDLERLLQVPDIAYLSSSPAPRGGAALYFEDSELELHRPLQLELYMPTAGLTNWQLVGTYSGTVSTAQLVAELADAVNGATLNAAQSNVLAAAVLASPGGAQLHELRFESRLRDALVSTELVSVRIRPGPVPFRWGVEPGLLRSETVNSVFVTVERGGSVTSGLPRSDDTDVEPVVLYFRRLPQDSQGNVIRPDGSLVPAAVWQNGQLTFRVSPTMDQNHSVPVPYMPGHDADRYSQVALLLLNELFALKADSRALGALIRNDDASTTPQGIAALELVAWSITNPQTWLILDVIEVPADIEMAVGNRLRPLTPWSNKPRSIRVPSLYRAEAGQIPPNPNPEAGMQPDVRLVKLPDSKRFRALFDEFRRRR